MLVKHTGQSKEKVEKDTDRDYFMSAEEAKGCAVCIARCMPVIARVKIVR